MWAHNIINITPKIPGQNNNEKAIHESLLYMKDYFLYIRNLGTGKRKSSSESESSWSHVIDLLEMSEEGVEVFMVYFFFFPFTTESSTGNVNVIIH